MAAVQARVEMGPVAAEEMPRSKGKGAMEEVAGRDLVPAWM